MQDFVNAVLNNAPGQLSTLVSQMMSGDLLALGLVILIIDVPILVLGSLLRKYILTVNE
jgi:hypothetical protein